MHIEKPEGRVIIPADYIDRKDEIWALRQSIKCYCQKFSGSGIFIQIKSALKICGFELITVVRDSGNKVFVDGDFGQSDDLELAMPFLVRSKPEMISVSIHANPVLVDMIRKNLPDTKVVANITAYSDTDVRWDKILESKIPRRVDAVVVRPQIAKFFRHRPIIMTHVRPPWIQPDSDQLEQRDWVSLEEALESGPACIVLATAALRDSMDCLTGVIDRIQKSKRHRSPRTREPVLQA